MWTPKRALIYLVALLGFLAVFGAVLLVLGKVDSLPPLPPHYVRDGDDRPTIPTTHPPEPEREFKLRQAFGNECEELKRKSVIWLPTKGAVLAIDRFEIEKDGRVKLSPFSVGLFPKSKSVERFPEINTVQSEYAFLTLDRPVTSLTELGRSKVVGVELGGERGVKLTNNRKSQEKSDDLELYVTEGKLFYEDARNLIWSNGYVKLLDTQSQPLPTQITAVGMEVVLSKDISPNRSRSGPPKTSDGVSGVERIHLLANVDMHLYTDARSGFMTGPDELAKKPEPAGPREKAHVHIKTNGKFILDLVKDTARFDAPLQPSLAHDRVTVTRHLASKKPGGGIVTDLLDCDRLDLQFRKKAKAADVPTATPTPAAPRSSDKDIESAVATAKPGAIVELHIEGEEMHAFGVEMHYFAAAKSGPRTIIKGAPMHAIRQGHEIRAEELHLKGADKQGLGQEAYAKGPGRIDLLDKKTGKASTHILFKTSFSATKDKDGSRVYDLLTLRGDAAYIDEANRQEMRAAQFMHVWVEQLASAAASSTPAQETPVRKPDQPKTRPHKIEAFEKVQVRSPDINISDADHVNVIFQERVILTKPRGATIAALPAISPSPTPAAVDPVSRPTETPNAPPPNATPSPGNDPPASPPRADAPPTPTALPATVEAKENKEKPKRPIELTARQITAYIATMGNAKELIEFIADGNVHVSQAAENPKDKGLDITGKILKLIRKPGGDVLEVYGRQEEGKAPQLAQLQHNEMILFGPKVVIDQDKNLAEVDGVGAMHMPSNTTLDGKKKDGHITIHWNRSMVFDGKFAVFTGGVEAFQDNGKMLSQEMQVTMDRPVVFRQTNGKQTAKIDRIVCNGRDDRRVFILEEDRDAKNKIITYRRLLLAVVEVDNIEQRLNGSGPGVLDFINEASAGDPTLQSPKAPANPLEDKILKWTRVRFEGQMLSYPTAAGGGRQTTFLDQVRVFHQPGDDPNLRDPTSVGKDGLFFTCQRLTIVQRKVNGRNTQEMIADGMTGMVNFQTEKVHGNAKTVKYDESKEQIIFEGTPSAPATLYKMPEIVGQQPQRIQGTKILYNRKTGEFLLDGVRVISSWLMPSEFPTPAIERATCQLIANS